MKLVYPACFYKEDEGYSVIFPDLPGCITQGDSLEEALEMAEDAALGWLLTAMENNEDFPKATELENVRLEEKESFSNLLLLDLGKYSSKHGTRETVKKTLTIPTWLNEKAEKMQINFSKVLQDALFYKVINKK